MKISRINTLVCDGGWQPWLFVKIKTSDGITGYGECSDGRNPRGVAGCIQDLAPILVGRDPRLVELLNADMYRAIRQTPGGIAQRAIAGIDAALWDIKAKALGVPVYELMGGPTRDRIQLYWTHCGTYETLYHEMLGVAPIRSLQDIASLGKKVIQRGFTALKTNIVIPGNPATVYMPGYGMYWGRNPTSTDLNITSQLIRNIESLIRTFRESVGSEVDIALDLNFNFRPEGFRRIAKVLEPFDLMWLEIDIYDPAAMLQVKESTSIPICSGETLYTGHGYKPFFDLHAMDVAMVDVAWNGLTVSKKIADLAEVYAINIAPHNCWSHLSTLMSAHLCAVATNVSIMEIDVESVPWKDDLIRGSLEIKDGHLIIPDKPGWGADLNEKEIAKHPWSK